VRQVGYLSELYEDAWSEKYKILRNKFIKQNSVNNEAAFMMNKLFSPFVGMEMMMDSSTEITAAAFLGCTHKPQSCEHLLSS